MNNSSTYFNLLRESTLAYFDRMNPGVLKRQPVMPSHLMTGGGDVLEQYKTYIKEHQGEWYKSQEFADMFVRCPPGALLSVARTYFGFGNFVRAGVNLSERVIECLESAFNMGTRTDSLFDPNEPTWGDKNLVRVNRTIYVAARDWDEASRIFQWERDRWMRIGLISGWQNTWSDSAINAVKED